MITEYLQSIVQIETGQDRYIHVIIYEDFRGKTLLTGIQLHKSLSDPIEYFRLNVDFDTSIFRQYLLMQKSLIKNK